VVLVPLVVVVVVPFVMPSSRPGRAADVTVTHARSAAGTIVSQSEMACEAAAASSAPVTLVVTGLAGAAEAVESIGFADEPVDDEPDELAAGAVDEELAVPVDVELVDVEPVEAAEVASVPVALVPDVVLPDAPDVPLDAVELDAAGAGVELEDVPVEVPLDEEGEPTVTVCVVLVPLVVVVVVPLLVVVVVVELSVVDVGHDTDWAWITTPGPKLQLLAAELAELGADPVAEEPEPLVDDGPGLVAAGTRLVMVIVLATLPGGGTVEGVFVAGAWVDGLTPPVPVELEPGAGEAPKPGVDTAAGVLAACAALAMAGTPPAKKTPIPANVVRATSDGMIGRRAGRACSAGRL